MCRDFLLLHIFFFLGLISFLIAVILATSDGYSLGMQVTETPEANVCGATFACSGLVGVAVVVTIAGLP
jgi:hypothetical protein